MIRMRLCWIAAVCAVAVSGWSAGEPPVCTAYRIAGPVTLDGVAREAGWQTLPETDGFLILSSQGVVADRQTFFRVGWDDRNLYFFIRCDQPEMAKSTAVKKDGDAIWEEDSVEIFLAPEYPIYEQLVVNSIGSRTWVRRNSLEWRAAAARDDRSWRCEIAIPFQVLPVPPADGMTWRMNIARNIPSAPEKFTTWAPVVGSFNDTAHFGAVVFSGRTLSPEEAARNTAARAAVTVAPLRERTKQVLSFLGPEIAELPDGPTHTAFERRLAGLAARLDTPGVSARDIREVQREADALLKEVSDLNLKYLLE